MEDTNGQVRRRGLERILVAATLAAVAMLGCSADHGGILLPTAPSAVNAPTTASSASAVATSTSTGAEAASSGSQITVDSSMMSTRRLNAATTDGVLTANFLFLSDHDGSSSSASFTSASRSSTRLAIFATTPSRSPEAPSPRPAVGIVRHGRTEDGWPTSGNSG